MSGKWLCECGRTLATQQEQEEGQCYYCSLSTCACGNSLEADEEKRTGLCAACLSLQKTLPVEGAKP